MNYSRKNPSSKYLELIDNMKKYDNLKNYDKINLKN